MHSVTRSNHALATASNQIEPRKRQPRSSYRPKGNNPGHLNIVEKAIIYDRLCQEGASIEEISQRTGHTQAHIREHLRFLLLPDEVLEMIDNHMVSGRKAKKMAKQYFEKARNTLTEGVSTEVDEDKIEEAAYQEMQRDARQILDALRRD